ncbi:hypothetical protein PITCH_A1330012 [uncultured Desulfobacterium sp.]|jgi:hypothetical protein|uniref:Uncharacterized protein n=1 Tax=uncultured Desulfobacterium sp. TaxID=201089 RepID=A0A445MSJ6_9BACT|nr:hypothetical protein PITCH_A1330012 [uncultured Desulfobacterium sp.]
MRVASTGLGKTELIAGVYDLKPESDFLGLHAMAISPAEWHLETYLEPKDVWPVVSGFLRPSILWTTVLSFIFFKKKGNEPENL